MVVGEVEVGFDAIGGGTRFFKGGFYENNRQNIE